MDTPLVENFFDAWRNPGNNSVFTNITKTDAEGEEARTALSTELLLTIFIQKQSIVPSIIYPFLAWIFTNNDTKEHRYVCYSSGIKPLGASFTPGKIELPRGLMLDTTIRKVFEGSLFPTVDELLEDEKFRKIRTQPKEEVTDYQRFVNVEAYLHKKYVCSQRQLFYNFRGAHYNIICRVPPTDWDRGERAPKPGARRLSSTGAELLSNVTAASAAVATAASSTVEGREKKEEDELKALAKQRALLEAADARAELDLLVEEERAAKVKAKSCCCSCSCCSGAKCVRCSWCPSFSCGVKKPHSDRKERSKYRTRKNKQSRSNSRSNSRSRKNNHKNRHRQ